MGQGCRSCWGPVGSLELAPPSGATDSDEGCTRGHTYTRVHVHPHRQLNATCQFHISQRSCPWTEPMEAGGLRQRSIREKYLSLGGGPGPRGLRGGSWQGEGPGLPVLEEGLAQHGAPPGPPPGTSSLLRPTLGAGREWPHLVCWLGQGDKGGEGPHKGTLVTPSQLGSSSPIAGAP